MRGVPEGAQPEQYFWGSGPSSPTSQKPAAVVAGRRGMLAMERAMVPKAGECVPR